jgi:hypothetical protein
VHGYLQKKDFQRWLARNVEVVGMADPESVQQGEKRYAGVIDDTIIVSSGAEAQTPGQITPAKRGRPKKKV